MTKTLPTLILIALAAIALAAAIEPGRWHSHDGGHHWHSHG